MRTGYSFTLSRKKGFLWNCAICVLFLGFFLGFLFSGAEASSDTVSRWMAPYWLEVPASWKPLVDRREGVMFFTGALPDMVGSPEGENLSILALGVLRQSPPKGGGFEDFIEAFEKQATQGDVRNFSSSREDIVLDSSPAVLFSFSGEAEMGGAFKKVGGTMIVTREVDAEGKLTLVMGMGNASGLEEYKGQIRSILDSARKGTPPLEKKQTFPYGATSEVFRYTFGLAMSSEGIIALGDSRNCRIRLFDSRGELLEEWGEKGKGEEGTFSYPRDFAFAPDGSLWVAEEGYSVRARLQQFSQKGEFLEKIELSPKVMGEKGIYKPSCVVVTDTGKVIVAGLTEISDGEGRILVFAPSGELLSSWEPGDVEGMTPLPGERLVLVRENPENDHNVIFCVYDLEGKELAQWPFYGSTFAPSPGDEEIYFDVEALASDGAGNIYVYDDSEEALWIYDEKGVFLQAFPLADLGIFENMTVSPGGDVVVHDRPSSYSPGEPSLHLFANTLVEISPKPSQPGPEIPAELPEEISPSPKESESREDEDALRAELERLKKALALREEALSLEKAGNLAGAAAKYRESLPLHSDPAVEAYAAELERRQEALEATPEPLQDAGVQEAPKKEPAISQSPQLPGVPALPDIAEGTKEMDTQPSPAPPEPPAISLGSPLYDEAERLEKEGRRYEALLKYKEALQTEPDPEMQAHARNLENTLRREAREMVAQAVAVQNQGKYQEALELYRKSLDVFYLKQVEEYANRLEVLLDQGTQSRDTRAKAEALWREGAELQKKWRYQEALKKYKEGLALSPDPKMEEHVRKLEAFLEGQK
ncbi:MAG TPA: hypothetical protein PK364_02790 [Synergistaceae bacterium]|nr:hypothetical protein [Synergistaceae bacterium]HPJ25646.1 hypothetical protein [Synergistaceae bacterium]HPQ38094.1 hypothetical protein [Synergistaceae bacterium]